MPSWGTGSAKIPFFADAGSAISDYSARIRSRTRRRAEEKQRGRAQCRMSHVRWLRHANRSKGYRASRGQVLAGERRASTVFRLSLILRFHGLLICLPPIFTKAKWSPLWFGRGHSATRSRLVWPQARALSDCQIGFRSPHFCPCQITIGCY